MTLTPYGLPEDENIVLESRRSQGVHRVEHGQWLWGGICFIIIVTFLIVGHLLGGFMLLLLAAAAFGVLLIGIYGSLRHTEGIGYEIFLDRLNSYVLRSNGGEITIVSKGDSKPRPGSLPIAIDFTSYPRDAQDTSRVGVLYSETTQYDNIILVGNGYANANHRGVERKSENLGIAEAILDGVNFAEKSSMSIGMGVSMGMVDILPSSDRMWRTAHEDVLARYNRMITGAEPVIAEDREMRIQLQRFAAEEQIARKTYEWLSVSMKRPKQWRKYGVEGRPARQLAHSSHMRAVNTIATNLTNAGIDNMHPLDPHELATFVNFSHSVNTSAWNEMMADWSSEDIPYPWPKEHITVKRDDDGVPYLKMDNAYLRVWQAVKQQRKKFGPVDFISLYSAMDIGLAPETGLTVSMQGDTFSSRDASKMMSSLIVIQRGLKKHSETKYRSHADIEAEEELQRQQLQYDLAGDVGLFHNFYVITFASSIEGLETVDQLAVAKARSIGLQLRVTRYEASFVREYLSAALGV